MQNKAASAAVKTDAAPEVTEKTDGKAETKVEMQEKSENTQEVFSGELALDEKKLMSKSDDVRETEILRFLKAQLDNYLQKAERTDKFVLLEQKRSRCISTTGRAPIVRSLDTGLHGQIPRSSAQVRFREAVRRG